MARYVAYNTDDPAAVAMKYGTVEGKGEVILQSLQTEKSEKVTGSIYSEQAGTIFVEQSFDGEAHWDISSEVAIVAKTAKSFEVNVIAPLARVRFVNSSASEIKQLRFFARAAYQQGK